MSQKKLLSQALSLIKSQKLYRRWLGAVTGMAAAVVFITTYLLILPAITMEHSIFQATASWIEAELGETILTEVYAEAADGREETFFVIKADGDNAGLDESQLYLTMIPPVSWMKMEGKLSFTESIRKAAPSITGSYWRKAKPAVFGFPGSMERTAGARERGRQIKSRQEIGRTSAHRGTVMPGSRSYRQQAAMHMTPDDPDRWFRYHGTSCRW